MRKRVALASVLIAAAVAVTQLPDHRSRADLVRVELVDLEHAEAALIAEHRHTIDVLAATGGLTDAARQALDATLADQRTLIAIQRDRLLRSK